MKRIVYLLALTLTTGLVHAAPTDQDPVVDISPVDLDLAQAPTVDDLEAVGLDTKPVKGLEAHRRSFESKQVTLRLADGRVFEADVKLADLGVHQRRITSMRLFGFPLAHDESLVEARRLHTALGIPLDDLDGWFAENRGRHMEAPLYSAANVASSPKVSLRIRKTYNSEKPWFIITEIRWDP